MTIRPLRLVHATHKAAPVADPDGRSVPRWLPWLIVVVTVLTVGLGLFITTNAADTEDANAVLQVDKAAVEGQRDAAVGQSLDLAAQVQHACTTGDLQPADPLCTRAAQVQAEPIPGIPGIPGTPGAQGAPGRGIVGTSISPSGRLLVAYTDGSTDDVGVVVGAAGATGADGRGITGTTLQGGRLVIAFSDGSTQDVGPVVGADGVDGRDGRDGRGVASVAEVDGRLVVTFTDGETQDVGPLPAGPRGDTGAAGPMCPAGTTARTVQYAGNVSGVGCVLDEQPTPTPAPTTAPGGVIPSEVLPGG